MEAAEASVMAIEAAEASKKHRRISVSDGAEEPSKRHKHHSSSSASRRDRDKDKDKDKDRDKDKQQHHHRHHKHKHHHRRKNRAETPTEMETDGHGSARVSADRQNFNGVPMEAEEEGRIRVARVSDTRGDGEEKEEGEIVEGEEYSEPLKTAESDIESGEIHSEEAASLKNGLDEVSSPKEVTRGFKMPADKELKGRTNQKPESKGRREDSKRELAGFVEGSRKADENAFKKATEHSCVDNGYIEKKKGSHLKVRDEEGDKLRGDVDRHDAVAGENFMLKYDEMSTKSDKNVANETAVWEAQNRSSSNHLVGYMETTEDGNKQLNVHRLHSEEGKCGVVEDGSKFSWERNDFVLEDNFKQVSCSAYFRDRRGILLEEDDKNRQLCSSAFRDSGKTQEHEAGYHRSITRDNRHKRRRSQSPAKGIERERHQRQRHSRSRSKDSQRDLQHKQGHSRSPLKIQSEGQHRKEHSQTPFKDTDERDNHPTQGFSLSPSKNIERERHHRRMDLASNMVAKDSKCHTRSQSPGVRERLECKAAGIEDDAGDKHRNGQYNHCDNERYRERRHSMSRDIKKDRPSDRNRSPDILRDKYRGKGKSPSRDSYRDRIFDIKRSRSQERRERHSHSRDRTQVQDDRGRRSKSREREMRYCRDNRDHSARVRRSISRDASRGGRIDDRSERLYSRHHRYEHQRESDRDRPRDRRSEKERASRGQEPKEDTKEDKDKIREEENQEEYQERVALQLAEQEEDDIEKIKEESRKRRQAILEKYRQQKDQKQTNEQIEQNARKDGEIYGLDNMREKSAIPAQMSSRQLEQTTGIGDSGQDGSDTFVPDPTFSVGKEPLQAGTLHVERRSCAGGLGEGSPKSDERSADMFCDDIFGESPARIRKSGRGDGLPVDTSGLHDNWDDAEGYYGYRIGEVLDGRYEVIASHGKGVFSSVVRAKDLKAGKGELEEVAIKIIRNNETMYKAGQEELIILKKLVGADPEDKRHCVRFLSSFKFRNHLCLVFESLHMNLREVLKKFGRNIGLKLTAVRAYAKQLFIALKHLKNCGVLHCDIKPDNMLVNEAKNVLKLCDFGNAMFAGKNEITPYLVSRFYRAPEIILGLPYDHAMDIWSVGCCLFELYLGKVLFPGPSNNDMLRLHMELKGPFPKKMLRKGGFTDQHFDQDLNFHATEEDPVTKKTVKRLLVNIKPKDISTLIASSPGEDPKMLSNFKDLLERIFILDPDKRITVSQALSHPFITGK